MDGIDLAVNRDRWQTVTNVVLKRCVLNMQGIS